MLHLADASIWQRLICIALPCAASETPRSTELQTKQTEWPHQRERKGHREASNAQLSVSRSFQGPFFSPLDGLRGRTLWHPTSRLTRRRTQREPGASLRLSSGFGSRAQAEPSSGDPEDEGEQPEAGTARTGELRTGLLGTSRLLSELKDGDRRNKPIEPLPAVSGT